MNKLIISTFIIIGLSFVCGCTNDGLILSDLEEENSTITTEYEEIKTDGKPGVIYLCGAVNNPGVYEFSDDTRLYEIVNEAGGLDEEADLDAINLAMEIKDGESIRIPYYGEKMSVPEDNLIDINSASLDELCGIPGIGESRASAIIAYREENGKFKSTEELMNISGIKEATYRKISVYVCAR